MTAPVVVCSSCDGMTFTLAACRCTYGGNRLLIRGDDRPRTPEPFRNCRVCEGLGQVARPCYSCGQTGRLRAQLVLTMANLDTGAVASVNLVPGLVLPRAWPDGTGWYLPIAPLIRELAAAVGAASWRDPRSPTSSTEGRDIFLPGQWQPDLPEPARRALETEAIALQSHSAWQVFIGRTAPDPPRDLDRELGRLCRLADLLCLDLVVEARRRPFGDERDRELEWDIRFEVPGAAVPVDTHRLHGRPARRGGRLHRQWRDVRPGRTQPHRSRPLSAHPQHVCQGR